MKVTKERRFLTIERGIFHKPITLDMYEFLSKDSMAFRLGVMLNALDGQLTSRDIQEYFMHALHHASEEENDYHDLICNRNMFEVDFVRKSLLKRSRILTLADIGKLVERGCTFAVVSSRDRNPEKDYKKRFSFLMREASLMIDEHKGWHYGSLADDTLIAWSESRGEASELQQKIIGIANEADIKHTMFIEKGTVIYHSSAESNLEFRRIERFEETAFNQYRIYAARMSYSKSTKLEVAERYTISRKAYYESDPEQIELMERILKAHNLDSKIDAGHLDSFPWKKLLDMATGDEAIL